MKIKLIRKILVYLFIIFFFILILIQSWAQIVGWEFSLSNLIYWFILIGLVYLAWVYKFNSVIFLGVNLLLFTIGILFTVIQFNLMAETLFRIGFVFLLVGIGKALLEYRKRLT